VLAHVVGADVVGGVQHHVPVKSVGILPFVEAFDAARVAVNTIVGSGRAVKTQGCTGGLFLVREPTGAQVARALAVGHQAAVQHAGIGQVEHPQAFGGVGQVHVGHGQQAGPLNAAGGVQREVAHAGLLQHGDTQSGRGGPEGLVQLPNGLAQGVGHIGHGGHRR